MKKVLVFPYNINSCEVIRYRHLIKKYNIIGAIAPIGWGIAGKDASFIDGGKETGLVIEAKIDYSLEFDGVIMVNDNYLEYETLFIDYANEIIANGKEIVFTSPISGKLKDICFKKNELISFDIDNFENNEVADRLMKINTPIILVAGMHEYTHKLKIQLEVNRYFAEKGYKISHIASKGYGALFDIHSFPDFMFSNAFEKNKIFRFNNYVHLIEKQERPDVIIIGVPGEMMPYNEKYPNNFGITLFEVIQAVRPDILVMSCLYEKYNREYFEKLAMSIQYKYGIAVDCFNISTFQVDHNETEQNHKLQYYKVTYKDVDAMLKNINSSVPIYNIMNGIDGEKIAKLIYKKLADYGEAECM